MTSPATLRPEPSFDGDGPQASGPIPRTLILPDEGVAVPPIATKSRQDVGQVKWSFFNTRPTTTFNRRVPSIARYPREPQSDGAPTNFRSATNGCPGLDLASEITRPIVRFRSSLSWSYTRSKTS